MNNRFITIVTKGEAAAKRIRTVRPFIWLLIAYALTSFLLMIINGYCKHLEVYMDESIYYGMAESLARGMGLFTIKGEPYYTDRVIYSLLISPTFLAHNRFLQFKLIALINAVVICSGAFPVYLLAKGVIKDNRCALLTGLLYLIQPDLQFTCSFMSENVMLPLSLWTIFLSWKLSYIKDIEHNRRVLWVVCWIISTIALFYTKSSGAVVALLCFIWLALLFVRAFIREAPVYLEDKQIRILLFVFAVTIILSFVAVFRFSKTGESILWQVSYYIRELSKETGMYFRCYLYTWASEILAIGVFPIILPCFFYKELSREAKRLFGLVLMLTLIVNCAIMAISILIKKSDGLDDFPLYHRYIIYIWLPFIILFIDAMRHGTNVSWICAAVTILVTGTYCVLFKGAIMGSSFEAPLLWWARDWMQHRWIFIVLITLLVAEGLLLFNINRKGFIILFTVIMIALEINNGILMHDTLYRSYYNPYGYISEVEKTITGKADKTFLVVTIPSTSKNAHYYSKFADTYLFYPNSYFVSDTVITANETEKGIDLTKKDIKITSREDLQEVDYIVLTNEMTIDTEGCEKVLANRFFTVFHLKDNTKIPYISKLE